MGGRRRSIVLAGTFVLAACSSGGDATPSTTTTEPPVTTGVTTTTEGSVTTTSEAVDDPTTTAAPTTTQPPDESTTTTSTTPPAGVPPRVTFPDDPGLQAVVDAAYAFFDRLRTASMSPDDETSRSQLATVAADPIASRVMQFLEELVLNGERVVANPEQATYIDVFAFTLAVTGDGATFDACVVDADVRVSIGDGPDGSDRVVDDAINSAVQTYQLVRDGDEWRVRDIERVARFEGEVGCE